MVDRVPGQHFSDLIVAVADDGDPLLGHSHMFDVRESVYSTLLNWRH